MKDSSNKRNSSSSRNHESHTERLSVQMKGHPNKVACLRIDAKQ